MFVSQGVNNFVTLRCYHFEVFEHAFFLGVIHALGSGPGCIKPAFKWVTYKSVIGTLTGAAWYALSSKFLFYMITCGLS